MQMKLRGLAPQNIGLSPHIRSFFTVFKSMLCTFRALVVPSLLRLSAPWRKMILLLVRLHLFISYSLISQTGRPRRLSARPSAFGKICSCAYGNRQSQETRRYSVPQFIDRRFRTRYTEKNKIDRPLALKFFLPKADQLKRRYSCENLYAGASGCRWRSY